MRWWLFFLLLLMPGVVSAASFHHVGGVLVVSDDGLDVSPVVQELEGLGTDYTGVVSRVYLYKYHRGSYDGFSWYRQGMIVIGGVSMDDPGLPGLLRHEVMHLWALNHGLYGLSTYDNRELLVDELVNQ